jgi:hypothetical protein
MIRPFDVVLILSVMLLWCALTARIGKIEALLKGRLNVEGTAKGDVNATLDAVRGLREELSALKGQTPKPSPKPKAPRAKT